MSVKLPFKIHHQYLLTHENTFGLKVIAQQFVVIDSLSQLREAILSGLFTENNSMILGGGSNVLFTNDFEGIIFKNNISGIEVENEDEDYVWIKAGSGEVWHQLVLYAVEHGWGGIENLSLIPGTAGAAPIQNIGAYGVELKDVLSNVEAMHLQSSEIKNFTNEECKFGYRESIFKHELKGKYFITSITLRLAKSPVYHIQYGAIKEILEKNQAEISVKTISDAVIEIRKSKLPDPAVLGNAGSFFKNPEIFQEQYHALKKNFPDMPSYPAGERIKIPAGWLIEQCGWKGKRIGNAGSHAQQALVLVNYGGATGKEIYSLALQIKESVFNKFGIEISTEVNII